MVPNLAQLCSSVLWKVEVGSDKTDYLAEEISKQSVEGVAFLLLTTYSEMTKGTDKLKMKLLRKYKLALEDLKKLALKGILASFNEAFGGLCEQKCCQFELKGTEMG